MGDRGRIGDRPKNQENQKSRWITFSRISSMGSTRKDPNSRPSFLPRPLGRQSLADQSDSNIFQSSMEDLKHSHLSNVSHLPKASYSKRSNSMDRGRLSVTSRSSISDRSSSVGMSRPSILGRSSRIFVAKRDIRNVKESKELNKLKLLDFLVNNHYPHKLKQPILSRPAIKDVQSIYDFLLSYLAGSKTRASAISMSKFSEELPRMLKLLGYPSSISRSVIEGCTNPHTWPHILGAFCWMVDIVNAQKPIQPEFLLMPTNEDKVVYEYMRTCYNKWMVEGCEDYSKEMKDLAMQLNQDSKEAEVLQLEEQKLLKMKHSVEFMPADQKVAKCKERLSILMADYAKIVEYKMAIGKANEERKAYLKELLDKLRDINSHIELKEKEIDRKQMQIKNQVISSTQALQQVRERTEQINQDLIEKFDFMLVRKQNLELQITEISEQVRKNVRHYESVIDSFCRTPSEAEKFKPLFNIDDKEKHFQNVIKPLFQATQTQNLSKISELERELNMAKAKLIHVEEEIVEEKRSNVKDKNAKINLELEEEKVKYERVYAEKREHLNELEAKVAAFDKEPPVMLEKWNEWDSKIVSYQELQKTVEASYRSKKAELVNEGQLMMEKICKICSAVEKARPESQDYLCKRRTALHEIYVELEKL